MSTKQKTILITGSTDGIGLETAKMLVSLGHNVLLHGRRVWQSWKKWRKPSPRYKMGDELKAM